MKINQIKFGVVLSYLQMGLNTLISLIYTPIMLRLLGQSEYGVYTLASSTIAYLGLLNFGMSSSYIRFFTRYKEAHDEKGLAQLNGVFFLVYVVIAIVALAAGITLGCQVDLLFGASMTMEELHKVQILMWILSANLFMTFLATVFTAYIGANEQFIFQKAVNMGKTVLSPFLTIPILLMGGRSIAVAVVTTIVGVLVDASNVVFCFRKLHMRFIFRGADFRIIREVAGFSFFIALNSLVDQVNWQIDKLILGHYRGTIATAVYGVASQLNAFYTSVSTSVSSVFSPRIHHISHTENREAQYTELFIKVGRIQLLILGLVAGGMILFGRQFICLWAGEDYGEAYQILLLLALPATIPLIQNIGIEIQRAENKHQFRSIVYTAMAIFNMCISIPLGKYYGGVGCAFGTCVAMLLANGIIMNWYYKSRLGIDILCFWKSVAPILLTAFIAGIIGVLPVRYFVKETFLSVGIGIVLYTILYCFLCWLIAMNDREKEMVRNVARKILHALKIAC